MSKIILDGREVKGGDRLWSLLLGWVTVVEFSPSDRYPIHTRAVVSRDGFSTGTFTADGAFYVGGPRCLYWNEVVIDPPAPPKPKVKKWLWTYGHEKNGGWNVYISSYYHADPESLRKEYDVKFTFAQKINATEIEVEE